MLRGGAALGCAALGGLALRRCAVRGSGPPAASRRPPLGAPTAVGAGLYRAVREEVTGAGEEDRTEPFHFKMWSVACRDAFPTSVGLWRATTTSR